MDYISQESLEQLQRLSERLKNARLERNETQAEFASRLGMSRNTYSRMEKGDLNIGIGYWIFATDLLGVIEGWEQVCKQPLDLFSQQSAKVQRKRARKKSDQS